MSMSTPSLLDIWLYLDELADEAARLVAERGPRWWIRGSSGVEPEVKAGSSGPITASCQARLN